jgi:hypothetical protein
MTEDSVEKERAGAPITAAAGYENISHVRDYIISGWTMNALSSLMLDAVAFTLNKAAHDLYIPKWGVQVTVLPDVKALRLQMGEEIGVSLRRILETQEELQEACRALAQSYAELYSRTKTLRAHSRRTLVRLELPPDGGGTATLWLTPSVLQAYDRSEIAYAMVAADRERKAQAEGGAGG